MVKVDKIIIDIGGKKVELTVGEVNKLYSQLKNICGDNGYIPYPVLPIYPYDPNPVTYRWTAISDNTSNGAIVKC